MTDPVELLRALAPSVDRGCVDAGVDAEADAMLRAVTGGVRVRHRRRRFVVGAVVATGALGAGAVAAVIESRQPSDATAVACWSSADLDRAAQVALVADGTPAVEQCADVWATGLLGAASPGSLTPCVTDTGIVAVVPGAETVCAGLGWTVAGELERGGEVDRSSRLVPALVERFADRCVAPAEARPVAEAILADLTLDWVIDDRRLGAATTGCTTFAVDATAETVVLLERPGI